MELKTVDDAVEMREILGDLASSLQVSAAFVCKAVPGDAHVAETLALVVNGEFLENRPFPLEGTPCERVYERGIVYHSHDVAHIYPDDKLLGEWGVESYLGVTIDNSEGEHVGHVGVMHNTEFTAPAQIETALRQVAHRVLPMLESKSA